MASIEVTFEEVKPPIKEVVLHLTPAEALAVGALTGASIAAEAYTIYKALNHAGFGYNNPSFAEASKRATRGINA